MRPQLQTAPRREQCVIVAPFDLFFFDADAAHTVWLDNLFLRLNETSSLGATLVYWEPEPGSNSSLWLTRLTVECDGTRDTRAVFAKEGNRIFAQGALRVVPGAAAEAGWRAHAVLPATRVPVSAAQPPDGPDPFVGWWLRGTCALCTPQGRARVWSSKETDCERCSADSAFNDCNGPNAFFSHATTLAFERCDFDRNVCKGPGTPGGVLQLGNNTAAQLIETGFGYNACDHLFLEEPTSFVYSDRHGDPSVTVDRRSKGELLPLDAAPASLQFPSADDAGFVDLQNVRSCRVRAVLLARFVCARVAA